VSSVYSIYEQRRISHLLDLVPGIVDLLEDDSWVHRVVESIEFLDEARVRRHLSIDFTIPEAIAPSLLAGDTVYIPIQVLAKRVLKALDVVDGEGRAVPVLTSDENGMIAGRVLVERATRFLGQRPDGSVRVALEQLADTRERSPIVRVSIVAAMARSCVLRATERRSYALRLRYAAMPRGAAVRAAAIERRIVSGRHAETKARYDRGQAEAIDDALYHVLRVSA
jgi:hypothetical protein